jgi:AGCS family alanine or glycine:cation symporter
MTLDNLQHHLHEINGYLWGWPTISLLIFTGVYLTVMLHGLQFTQLVPALVKAFSREGRTPGQRGTISNYQALMTALAGTVGTGNVAGVATAIAIGGPGALFWMWVTGLLGMATKFSEALLGVHYRQVAPDGSTYGGPMYYMVQGIRWKTLGKTLALLYALFLVLANMGAGGMVQSNSIADILQNSYGISPTLTGVVLTLLTAAVILGGIQRIAHVTETVVPAMILLYVGVGSVILIANAALIPDVLATIFHDAFYGTAAAGGFIGAGVKEAMRMGFARGIFSNESGLGSAAIPAAAARTKHPAEQALISMTQTFIDTLVVCTFTGLVILLSGLWSAEGRNGSHGAALTSDAFSQGLGLTVAGWDVGSLAVSISLFFFVFSTLVGWGYYGQKCAEYLWGRTAALPYKLAFLFTIFLGGYILDVAQTSTAGVQLVWSFAEGFAALMILPNLVALIILAPQVRRLALDYFAVEKGRRKKLATRAFANG